MDRFEVVLICLGITGVMTVVSMNTTGNTILKPDFSLSCPQPNISLSCPGTAVSCPECEVKELPLFLEELVNVNRSNKWEEYRYMCGNFAVEYFRRLKNMGMTDVYFCHGEYLPADELHYWVKIGMGTSLIFETTKGEIVSPDEYKENYREIRCNTYIRGDDLEWIKASSDNRGNAL